MSANSRFAVAVHILTLLAQGDGEPVSSEVMASSINTNPSLVRRLIGMLTTAGLTVSERGPAGGTLLARPAWRIRLIEAYRAVEGSEIFGLHSERPNPECPVGRNIQAALGTRFDAATAALEAELSHTTIADMFADVRQRERARVSD
jgi:DNA-binding IscR family transcriptional regulator